MKIYLDYLFLENFLITVILIIETKMISKVSSKKSNVIISGLISAIYVVIMIIFKVQALNITILKITLSIVIVYLAFRPKTLKVQIKLMFIYYLLSIVNLGAVIFAKSLFNLRKGYLSNLIIYCTGLALSYVSIKHLWRIYKNNIKMNSLIYDVTINVLGSRYKYKAFLDTGNSVYSSEMKAPIIFANYLDQEMKKLQKVKKQFTVYTETFSKTNKWNAFLFEDVEIVSNGITYKCKAGIVFTEEGLSGNKSYNMVLNYNLFEEKLGGIKI